MLVKDALGVFFDVLAVELDSGSFDVFDDVVDLLFSFLIHFLCTS